MPSSDNSENVDLIQELNSDLLDISAREYNTIDDEIEIAEELSMEDMLLLQMIKIEI